MRRPLADLFPNFITFCCNIMALIAFQLVTTIYWVVLGDALTKSGNIAIFTPATMVATQNIAIFTSATMVATQNIAIFTSATTVATQNIAIFTPATRVATQNIAIFTPATTVATQNIAIFIPTTTAATPRRPFKIQIVMLIMMKINEKVYRI